MRLIGIGLSGFSEDPARVQLSFFDLTDILQAQEATKQERIDKAMDAIRGKHGSEKYNLCGFGEEGLTPARSQLLQSLCR